MTTDMAVVNGPPLGRAREMQLLVNRVLACGERVRRRRERLALAAAFDGLAVLEIGGPSTIFGPSGLLPLYDRVASVDAANYSEATIWDEDRAPKLATRQRFVAEATSLGVPDDAYEGLIASHVLEHVANCLAALREWRRVVVPSGPLLIVLPHRDFTFDHRRAPTPIEHFLADDAACVDESDLTHVREVLALHDARHDFFAGSREDFERRCWANEEHRAIHHHVFVTASAIELVRHADLDVRRVLTLRPYHIAILAVGASGGNDAAHVPVPTNRSPFPSDRR